MQIPDVIGNHNHIGKKIERIRELKGMKQETLAAGLGCSQQAVSKMEMSKEIDEEKLGRVAEILGVSVEGIKKFNEEQAIYSIGNNYDNATNNNLTFNQNPLEKIVELYERLLAIERNKVTELQKKLEKKS